MNLAWGGSDSLASSGMMSIMRREGGRQIGTGTYDGDKLERLRLLGQAFQRHMRRRVVDCELQAIHTRAPAPELYWAVVASMVDDGTVNANVMRRDAPDPRTLRLVEQGKQSVCDPFWLAKLRAGPLWLSNATAPTLGEPLSSRPPPQPTCTLASRWRKHWTSYGTYGFADRTVLRLPTLRYGAIRRRSRRL